MSAFFRNLISHFISDKCFNEYFVRLNFSDVDCLKETISKGLGAGIILGSTLVKLPQILKIFNAKSAEGISFLGILLELVSITSAASYNFAKGYPFSSWGESLFLMIETATIGFLVLMYSSHFRNAGAFALMYSMAVYMLFNGFISVSTLWSMQIANVPIVVMGKMIQANKNYQNGHTGQLSLVTMSLLFIGCLVRIFTTIQETGDSMLAFTFSIAAASNGVILGQILYYWNVTAQILSKKKLSAKKHS